MLLLLTTLGCGSGSGTKLDGGALGGAEALTIQTDALPFAIAGKTYAASLSATGGMGPRVWSISGVIPSKLDWMTLDASGNLSGTPTDVTAAAVAFAVQVSDSTGTVKKSVSISVNCHEGDTFLCGVPSSTLCILGSRTCTGGQINTCVAAGSAGSHDFSICGPDCHACDPQHSNLCSGGQCECGSGTACGGAASTCCGTAGSPDAGCVDTTTDVHNCSQCGADCANPGRINANPSCLSAECHFTCKSGFDNCSLGKPISQDGCPINLQTDLNNCGFCGNVCSNVNIFHICRGGQCF